MKAGVSAGVGHALERLSNYYIALAEKCSPLSR